jgi:hypothetical protein
MTFKSRNSKINLKIFGGKVKETKMVLFILNSGERR